MAASLLIGASYLAGLLVSVSPCVLPITPLIVGGAAAKNRWGPAVMAGGLVAAFTTLGVIVTALGPALGLSSELIRNTGATLLLLAGLAMLLPVGSALSGRLLGRLAGQAGALSSQLNGSSSLWAQFGIGALLGAVWAPCAGPVLGGAIGLAAQEGLNLQATLQMLAFGLGTVTPLLAIAYGARQFMIKNRKRILQWGGYAKPVFGVILLAAGVLVLSGLDAEIQAFADSLLPQWFTHTITSI